MLKSGKIDRSENHLVELVYKDFSKVIHSFSFLRFREREKEMRRLLRTLICQARVTTIEISLINLQNLYSCY